MEEGSGSFMSREDQRALVGLLREIPGLVEDLAITLTRQDCIGKGGMRVATGGDEQPLPLNMGASTAADELYDELAFWVRRVCVSRLLEFIPVGSVPVGFVGPLRPGEWRLTPGYRPGTVSLARWLDRMVAGLAMTPGSDLALPNIKRAMHTARRAMDLPDEDEIVVDEAKHAEARELELNATGIAVMARELGAEYAGLSANRVETLRKAGAIHAVRCVVATKAHIFRLGDVLDAHLAHPTRQRRIEA